MLIAENVQTLDDQNHSIDIHIPVVPVNSKNDEEELRLLWQKVRTWEKEVSFWSEEYQSLKKMANMYCHGRKGMAKSCGRTFRSLEKMMEQTFPIYQKSIRNFHRSLRLLSLEGSYNIAERNQEMQKIDRRLTSFKSKVHALKLDFLNTLCHSIPMKII